MRKCCSTGFTASGKQCVDQESSEAGNERKTSFEAQIETLFCEQKHSSHGFPVAARVDQKRKTHLARRGFLVKVFLVPAQDTATRMFAVDATAAFLTFAFFLFPSPVGFGSASRAGAPPCG